MLFQKFVTQPAGAIDYLTLFRDAFTEAKSGIKEMKAAVAYATHGGVLVLEKACRDANPTIWTKIKKQWLVGIDYCRTEPLALQRLMELPNSEVRIHAGTEVLERKSCMPKIPFHPKTYLVQGKLCIGAICGSGNLSANGLTRGHEIGNLMLTIRPKKPEEIMVRKICLELACWYENSWKDANSAQSIIKAYSTVYENAEHLKNSAPTDDDSGDTSTINKRRGRRNALDPDDLRKLRTCKHFWIEAGNLHENLGQGKPGNQLMLTRMTRVFFRFQAQDLERDTFVGYVRVEYDKKIKNDCALRFSNNSMDVVSLPIPGDGGPEKYDQENLLFEKQSSDVFLLSIGSSRDKNRWISYSKKIDGYHEMTSGRKWGVF